MKKPVIALTMGDPTGVGPEIVLAAAMDASLRAISRMVIVGDMGVLKRALELKDTHFLLSLHKRGAAPIGEVIEVLEVSRPALQKTKPGEISAEAGEAAHAFILAACDAAEEGVVDAIATSPIHKGALRAAGISDIGHTEIFGARFGVEDPLTMFQTEAMRIFFYSRHLSLREAIEAIEEEQLTCFFGRVHKALIDLGVKTPRIALAALNPHASDGGQFGDEEGAVLAPAVARAKALGLDISGPVGADSVFHQALEGRYDGVVSLYHDQGHIAAKTRDFHGTVTATLGLGVLRTSVDHGTAMDIAWQGIANPRGMKEAVRLAAQVVREKGEGGH